MVLPEPHNPNQESEEEEEEPEDDEGIDSVVPAHAQVVEEGEVPTGSLLDYDEEQDVATVAKLAVDGGIWEEQDMATVAKEVGTKYYGI